MKESGLTYSEEGWVPVSALLSKLAWKLEDLNQIVANNNKKRYEFSSEGSKIRACQGHSVCVDLKLPTKVPPEILFHGTALANVGSIKEAGLQKRNRHAVHLSAEKETALNVGSRHSNDVVVLKIRAKALNEEKGIPFEISTNGVWLVDQVPPEYIEF